MSAQEGRVYRQMRRRGLGTPEEARKTLVRAPCTGLRYDRTVRISHTILRDHDAAVGAVAENTVVAAAAANTNVVVVAASGTVVAAVAANTAMVAVGSILTTIYRRTCRHPCHVLHHDDLCRCDDLPIPLVDLPGPA